jgi:hypothetical protein
MKKQIILVALLLLLGTPLAQADNVTVHGTVGMLEAQLVTNKLEPVGTVNVWNTAMDMNIVVTPDSERAVLSKVYIYLSTDPAPPPITDEIEREYQRLDEAVEECVAAVEECEAEREACVEGVDDGEDPSEECEKEIDAHEAALQDYQNARNERDAYVKQYPSVDPDYAFFGEWPYGTTFTEATADPYSLTAHLSEIKYLQWGQWGEPWLQKRLVTVGSAWS